MEWAMALEEASSTWSCLLLCSLSSYKYCRACLETEMMTITLCMEMRESLLPKFRLDCWEQQEGFRKTWIM